MPSSEFSAGEVGQQVQIGGLIRFSIPCDGGYQQNPETTDEKRAMLYAPARMAQRFAYFETFCLHTLKRQTDPNFTIGVLVGEDMPRQYRQHLESLLKDLPQARVIVKPCMPYQELVAQALDEVFDQNTPFRLSFRLDDDDAVALDYIAELRARLPHIFSLSGGVDPIGIAFLHGLTLIKGQIVPTINARPLGLGLSVLAPAARKVHVFSYAHEKLHQNMPVLMDPYPVMSLRSFHDSNDSRVVLPAGRRPEMNMAEIAAILARRFALDINVVLAL